MPSVHRPQSQLNDSEPAPTTQGTSLFRSATLLSIGNVASRVLGLAREVVIANIFGPSGLVSAFTVASIVPTMLYDFLIGGMLSAALVPVLSDYARPERRTEMIRLVGALTSLLGLTLAAVVLLLQVSAPQVAWLLAGGFDEFDPQLLPLTVQLIRWISPAVWFFSMAGLLTAVLYALQRFTFPALATAIYNLGIVAAAPLLVDRLGIMSLVVGVLVGSAAQFVIMAWDVQRAGVRFRLVWSHPALRQIVRLYIPIAAGLVVAQFQVGLDRRLASGTGAESIAWMRSATTLQQLPLGLISVAISLAALPRLSQFFAARREDDYRRTLANGLRMVLVLIVPAVVGLWLLAEPVVRLIFEHGQFNAEDTVQVVQALRVYLVGALFAAIDFPLNYAFYARNNTLLPALVGVLSVGVYAATAVALIESMGYLGLVWADTAKQAGHALVMVVLLLWLVGRLRGEMGRAIGSVLAGAAAMTLVTGWLGPIWINRVPVEGTAADLVWLVGAGGSGAVAYILVLGMVGMPEVRRIRMGLWQRLRPARR
ncbi:MAG: murein biosynthesis integral membrane protein MurJ [Caldilineaceae bacterium]|nr:murein biosynthesis integral membrane protein MurJ [Caldilineaceae bacterium]